MSSLPRSGRVIRAAVHDDEVFVFGTTTPFTPLPGALATAAEILESAEQQAAQLLQRAQAEAEAVVAGATSSADEIRRAAHAAGYDDGLAAGRQAGLDELETQIAFVRDMASKGKSIRDSFAEQSLAVIARAVALATRRVVGEYYEAGPGRTTIACTEALRAAAGQEILSIRVHPDLVDAVQAKLVDVADYVRPDDGVAVGGCIIDLQHGTLDATLDSRLSLMELALAEASGEASR
ncbi:MAG: FliH/SctL family protein [Dehalococcoidia bacterium]|nr:FliH/SctL family protein [Dehalococcoidia bacterium]